MAYIGRISAPRGQGYKHGTEPVRFGLDRVPPADLDRVRGERDQLLNREITDQEQRKLERKWYKGDRNMSPFKKALWVMAPFAFIGALIGGAMSLDRGGEESVSGMEFDVPVESDVSTDPVLTEAEIARLQEVAKMQHQMVSQTKLFEFVDTGKIKSTGLYLNDKRYTEPAYAFEMASGAWISIPKPGNTIENDMLLDRLNAKGIRVIQPLHQGGVEEVKSSGFRWWYGIPIGIMILLGILAFRFKRQRDQLIAMQGGAGMPGAMGPGGANNQFGLNGGNFDEAELPGIAFDDIGGYDEVVEEMEKVKKQILYAQRNFMKQKLEKEITEGKAKGDLQEDDIAEMWDEFNEQFPPRQFKLARVQQSPKGVLMTGPPGTGKTTFARAMAGECQVPIIKTTGSDFTEMLKGVGAQRVRNMFAAARRIVEEKGFCIIFIDEFDALGKQRETGPGADTEQAQALNQLLDQMDGFDKDDPVLKNIMLMAATNFPQGLDKAVTRPGRFTKQFEIGLPQYPVQRKEILDKHVARIEKEMGVTLGDDVNLMQIAKLTQGKAGADLANIMDEAAELVIEQDETVIHQRDLREAFQRSMMGKKKKTGVPQKMHEMIAGHEVVGHGLVGLAAGIKPLIISMEARRKSMGHVFPNPEAFNEGSPSKGELLARTLMAAGGRAAEQHIWGDLEKTMGADQDYEQMRNYVLHMISSSMFAGHTATNYVRNPQTPIKPKDDELMTQILDHALVKAVEIIDRIPEEQRWKLIQVSLEGKNFEDDDALALYTDILGPMDNPLWQDLFAIADAFMQNPQGKEL